METTTTTNSSENYHHIGKLMRAAREYKKESQLNVSIILKCSQSALSKYEQGQMVVSAPQWFDFCRYMEIPYDSMLKGILDRALPLEKIAITGEIKSGNRLISPCGQRSRELYPFFEITRKIKGNDFLDWTMKTLGMKGALALDFDYQVSFFSLIDLINLLQKNKVLGPQNVNELAQITMCEIYHGPAWARYFASQDLEEFFTIYIEDQKYFQIDFSLNRSLLENRKVILTLVPEPHIKDQLPCLAPKAIEFYVAYKQKCLEMLLAKTHIKEPVMDFCLQLKK